nr:hypothetical protein [uncultured Mucilaginibacter sp.]
MHHKKDLLTKWIKQQAESFLLDAREFFPFGTYINKMNEVIPCSAYLEDENDQPGSLPLIKMLEDFYKKGLESGNVLIGAIGIDVVLNERGKKHDGLQIRFFENGSESTETLKYVISDDHVDFY